MTLLLTDCDYSKRRTLYQSLVMALMVDLGTQLVIVEEREDLVQYSGLEKNPSFYILEALRTNEKLDREKVMPFIDFCLLFVKQHFRFIVGNSYGESGLKLQLIMLKNSLAVANHMKITFNKIEES